MKAELIAVGSELLRYGFRDTNSEWLVERLQRVGLETTVRTIVDDDAARVAGVVGAAWARSDFVVICGGLGPTEDDRTRESVARALDRPLEPDARQLDRLRRRYARAGRAFGEAEARQALLPAGARSIDNPLGSAAGLLVHDGERMLAALPGVPAELRAMFDGALLPLLRERVTGLLGALTLKIVGRSEAALDRALAGLDEAEGLDLTVLGGPDGLELHARARGLAPAEIERRLGAFERAMRERLGEDLYGVGDETLHELVGRLLTRGSFTVATAESCTAGMLAAALTATPGASGWFRGGLIVYDDELKRHLAGVRGETLAAHGAVSEAVACELAGAARARCAADFGIGVTGIAGPDGGSHEKPVGLVHLALDGPTGGVSRELRLVGDRETIRRRTVTAALDALRRALGLGR